MTELERLAMMGDRQAQEEATRRGILLPCPFCGRAAIVEYDTMEPFEYTVFCGDCGVLKGTSEDKQVAVSEWNSRPAPPVGRCKDCAYFSGKHCLKLWSETNLTYQNQPKVGEDDYCSKFKKFEISKIAVENTCRLAIMSYNFARSDYERYKKMYGELSDRALEAKRRANWEAYHYNEYVLTRKSVFEKGMPDDIVETLEYLD